MSKAIITTLTASDYKDFRQEFSEKNIINQVFGNEYIINTASSKIITDINSKITEFNVEQLVTGSSAYPQDFSEVIVRGLFAKQSIQARNEYFRTSGSFTIETNEIISDINGIAVKVMLDYDKYYGDVDLVTKENFNSYNPVYLPLFNAKYKQNTEPLVAEENIPYETSKLVGRRIAFVDLWNGEWELSKNYPPNNITIKCKKIPNGNYQIVVNYEIITWWGKNFAKADKWGQSNNATLFVVKKLKFSVSANIVDASEIEFNYSRNEKQNYVNAQGKTYGIESNEFMQTDENVGTAQRQSYLTSHDIFNAFSQDRPIITFLLLNCVKYDIINEKRYLRSEDCIYIKDEHGELIGDEINSNGELIPSVFEIIKTRPIWDGSFMMECVCKKIDMTPA